jgi:hypothetical protein
MGPDATFIHRIHAQVWTNYTGVISTRSTSGALDLAQSTGNTLQRPAPNMHSANLWESVYGADGRASHLP